MALNVFLSYARNDDLPPLEGGGHGFVTTLIEHLEYRFKQLGPPRPHIWRDKRNIARSNQFDHIIEEAVNGADVFLAVLSNNWKHSEYCNQELETFAKRWVHEGERALKERIFVVLKHEMDDAERPPLMARQEGYRFYHPAEEEMWEQEFFADGEASKEFHALAKDLARDLWRRAKEAEGHSEPVGSDDRRSNGRKIYLAKPAGDMLEAYSRLSDELRKNGYTVAPAPEAEIPRDASAMQFLDTELAGAEASIHLLGERGGYAPEDCDPIVKLQLAHAAARAAADPAFRRIIWAPRLYNESERADAPFGVLERFDRQLAADKIEGSEISKFCEFVIQHLELTAPVDASETGPKATGEPQGLVYVYCDNIAEDKAYARKIVKALQGRDLEAVLPAFKGDPGELRLYHAQTLRDCSAVVLCWANATDLWVKSNSRELKNWKLLGRSSKFAVRGLAAAPPRDDSKEELIDVAPRTEIDVVLDLTGTEEPPPGSLDPIIDATRAWQST